MTAKASTEYKRQVVFVKKDGATTATVTLVRTGKQFSRGPFNISPMFGTAMTLRNINGIVAPPAFRVTVFTYPDSIVVYYTEHGFHDVKAPV